MFSVRPTREGVLYFAVLAFVLAAALLRDINLLVLIASLMAGPPVVNWLAAAVGLRKLRAVRTIPLSVCAGDLVVADVAISNVGRRAAWLVAAEDLIRREGASSGGAVSTGVLFPRLPAGATLHAAYRGRLSERGRYHFGPLRLTTRFPFGLARRSLVVGGQASLTVYPRLGSLTRSWHALVRGSREGTRRAVRSGQRGSEFHSLRDWRSGDNRRWIHWRTSARRGGLVVRQFEEEQMDHLLIVLDLWRPDAASGGATRAPAAQQELERAICFAATVVDDACRRGTGRLVFAAAGRSAVHLAGPASLALAREVLECLAVVEPAESDRLSETLRRARSAAPPDARVVVISARPLDLDSVATPDADLDGGAAAHRPGSLIVVNAADPALDQYFQPTA